MPETNDEDARLMGLEESVEVLSEKLHHAERHLANSELALRRCLAASDTGSEVWRIALHQLIDIHKQRLFSQATVDLLGWRMRPEEMSRRLKERKAERDA